MNANIEVKETPKLNLAGVTHVGVNGIEKAFEKLVKWATPKEFLKIRTLKWEEFSLIASKLPHLIKFG